MNHLSPPPSPRSPQVSHVPITNTSHIALPTRKPSSASLVPQSPTASKESSSGESIGRLARLLEAASIRQSSIQAKDSSLLFGPGDDDLRRALADDNVGTGGMDNQRRKDMDERWKRRHVSALDLTLE